MIQRFQASDFGCLKNVEAHLTPLHAFIGPNDSGKTTLLRAIQAAARFVTGVGAARESDPRELLFGESTAFELGVTDERGVAFVVLRRGETFRYRVVGGNGSSEERDLNNLQQGPKGLPPDFGVGHACFARFDPASMREVSKLVPTDRTSDFFRHRGHGLSGLLGTVFLQDGNAHVECQRIVQELFPTLRDVYPTPVGVESQVELRAELTDGTRVSAKDLSDGLLYLLAFFALQYLEGVKILLVEEPENGLHPARIADVVRTLRDLTERRGMQVILSTHSPLVINELKPEEITVVTRQDAEEGSRLTRMSDVPNLDRRMGVYSTLGGLWLSYADGKFEDPLLRPVANSERQSE
jgi:predicted ATPase